jgi:hypothetical protein
MADEHQPVADDSVADMANEQQATGADDGDTEASFEELLAEEMDAVRESKQDTADDGADGDPVEGEESEETQRPETDVKAEPKAKPKAAEERPVRIIQRLEAENVELRKQVKELRESPRQDGFRPSGDIVTDFEAVARMYAGKDADAASTRQVLQNAGRALVAYFAEGTKDPELLRLQAEREANRKHAEVQRQIDELRRQKDEAAQAVSRNEGVGFVRAGLTELNAAEEFPYLYAAESDVESTVYDGIQMLVDSGYRIADKQSAFDAMAYVAKRLDDDHRATAERLGRVGRKAATPPTQLRDETRGARKDGPETAGRTVGRPKTVTASGASRGTTPPQRDQQGPKTTDELFEDLLREERQEKRRNAASRTRRD